MTLATGTRKTARETLIQRLLPTIYEDEHLLVVAKPAGIDAGGLKNQPVSGLVELLTSIRGDTPGEPANRLSRYESGILMLGKNPLITRHIRSGLRMQRIEQEFVAVVLGKVSSARRGNEKTSRVAARPGSPPERKRVPQSKKGEDRAAPGETLISPMQHGTNRTLVQCRTTLPTTHALRARLRAMRHRLLGDLLNPGAQRQSGRPLSQATTCLHLSRVILPYPPTQKLLQLRAPTPPSFAAVAEGAKDVARPLHAALVRRLPSLIDKGTDCLRLLTGDVEDVPGLVVEKYADLLILTITQARRELLESLKIMARWYRDVLGVRSIMLKRNLRGEATPLPAAEPLDELILGTPPPEELVVQERGLRMKIRPAEGLSVGLFLDHRENRGRLRALAKDREVLNLFAYTCGFSVVAAAGGAKSTVSVDLSGRFLDWGRENFALNHLDANAHEFVRSEAREYLRRAARQGRRFDLLIIDPPSFAHGRKRGQDFSVARDLAGLVADALNVLAPGGIMLVSTNYRRMGVSGLRERIRKGAGPRAFRVLETPALPADFAVDPDHARTIIVQFD